MAIDAAVGDSWSLERDDGARAGVLMLATIVMLVFVTMPGSQRS
jgi:hypothetical protein